jgi:hypothetical protein
MLFPDGPGVSVAAVGCWRDADLLFAGFEVNRRRAEGSG